MRGILSTLRGRGRALEAASCGDRRRLVVNGWVILVFGVVRATVVLAAMMLAAPAHAFEIILNDVDPMRIERQRAEARGDLPTANAPDLDRLDARLAEQGLSLGNHVFLRIFKQEAELEVWMRRDDRYVLFARHPICFWSGTLGPKLQEGDKQTPEGFYTITRRQLHWSGRWPRALNLGFPNAYDRANDRTGSYILIHGGCSSVGCYAMTDPVKEEIYTLVRSALRRGRQRRVHVHAFPFRMTEANMAAHAASEWASFWRNLKTVHDLFDETRVPPQIGVCNGEYVAARADARKAANMAIYRWRPRDIDWSAVNLSDPFEKIICAKSPPEDAAPRGQRREQEAGLRPNLHGRPRTRSIE